LVYTTGQRKTGSVPHRIPYFLLLFQPLALKSIQYQDRDRRVEGSAYKKRKHFGGEKGKKRGGLSLYIGSDRSVPVRDRIPGGKNRNDFGSLASVPLWDG
jgi:hypothetical protein